MTTSEFYVMLHPQTKRPQLVFRAVHEGGGMTVERLTADGWIADVDVYENVVSGEVGLRIVSEDGAKAAATDLYGPDAWDKKGGEQSGGTTEGDGGAGGPTPAG